MVVARDAHDGGGLVGAYYLKPNFAGRGAHVANAGYFVVPARRGQGVGRLLVEDSLWRAPLLGFDAMQFNLVFASNPARRLYEELGFRVTGHVPDAVDGEDAVVYWRRVGGEAGGERSGARRTGSAASRRRSPPARRAWPPAAPASSPRRARARRPGTGTRPGC